jgi:hypothetical protein
VDPVGSGQGPVAGSCKYGDKSAGSGAKELDMSFIKALPLHATEALVGRGGIDPTHSIHWHYMW